MTPARQPQQEYIITDEILKSWIDVSPDHYIVKRIKQHARPHTSAPAPEPDDNAVFNCCNAVHHDIAARAAKAAMKKFAEDLKKDLESRFIPSSNRWSNGRNSGLIECCNIIDESLRQPEPQQGNNNRMEQ